MRIARPSLLLLLAVWMPAAAQETASPLRLTLSRDGAVLHRGGRSEQRFATLAELATACAGLRGEFEVTAAAVPATPAGTPAAAPGPGRKAPAAIIAAGEAPAIELARLLADLLDLPLISEGADAALRDRTILVPRRLETSDVELVKRLLEAGGFRVLQSTLESGQRVLLVQDTAAGFEPAEPRPRPIVQVDVQVDGGGEPRSASQPPRPARPARPPPQEVQGYAGVVLAEVPEMLRAQVALELGEGILVEEVDAVLAARSGALRQLRRFDIVTHVGPQRVARPADLVEALNNLEPEIPFELRVLRKGVNKILSGTK